MTRRKEVIATTEYYENQQPGLGEEFLAELHRYIDQILAGPLQFEQVRPGIRRCSMNRFPFGIYFRMPDENTVRIIIVRHHRRRSTLGMKRK
jgi:toxin ParE1/3/4